MATGVSVRALASPGFVLALVVLVLNDHVLKTAYPGWVTGKLSDVAGLVVAPLLLGVLLTAWRVPRPLLVAITLVGLGFTLTKSTAAGAATASDLWSLTGIPTYIRADTTDLLVLPALYGAWWVHRASITAPSLPWRHVIATASAVAVLPLAVLGTAATGACEGGDGAEGIGIVTPRVLIVDVERSTVVVNGSGLIGKVSDEDRGAMGDIARKVGPPECTMTATCWRARPGSSWPTVERSDDGGATWVLDLDWSRADVDEALDGVGPRCGRDASAAPRGVAVVGGNEGPIVVLAAAHVGLLLRAPDGTWTRVSLADVDDLPIVPSPV
jgi:hypothetical protein